MGILVYPIVADCSQIATPGNELYGKHLSKEEADKFLAPKPESVQTVQEWLSGAGLGDHAEVDGSGDNILVHASVADVEKLLHAEYDPFGMPPSK